MFSPFSSPFTPDLTSTTVKAPDVSFSADLYGLTSVHCKYTWGGIRAFREGEPDSLCELNVFLCNFEWPFNPEMNDFVLLVVII